MNALNLAAGAPSAQRMAQYAQALAAQRGLNGGVWDISQLPGARELVGLGRLLRLWTPAFNATPRVHPAKDFLEGIATQWGPFSLERRFFERALSAATQLPWLTLLEQERRNLKKELAGEGDENSLVALFLACVEELIVAEKDEGHIVVNPDNAELAVWTRENLAVFLRTHWALQRAARDLEAFLAKRAREFAGGGGLVDLGVGAAATHDDPDVD